jgi:hypothetical protein
MVNLGNKLIGILESATATSIQVAVFPGSISRSDQWQLGEHEIFARLAMACASSLFSPLPNLGALWSLLSGATAVEGNRLWISLPIM